MRWRTCSGQLSHKLKYSDLVRTPKLLFTPNIADEMWFAAKDRRRPHLTTTKKRDKRLGEMGAKCCANCAWSPHPAANTHTHTYTHSSKKKKKAKKRMFAADSEVARVGSKPISTEKRCVVQVAG